MERKDWRNKLMWRQDNRRVWLTVRNKIKLNEGLADNWNVQYCTVQYGGKVLTWNQIKLNYPSSGWKERSAWRWASFVFHWPLRSLGSDRLRSSIRSDQIAGERKERDFFFLLFFSPPLSVPVPVIFLRQSVSQSVSQRAQEPAELSWAEAGWDEKYGWVRFARWFQ
jgi:hypothetical protein